LRFTPYPPDKKVASCDGECTSIISASPLWAVAIAAPVPCAIKLTVIQGYLAWNADFIFPVPLSSSPVSWRLVVVETVKVVGVGVGVGDGEADGDGEAVGLAVGLEEGETDGLAEGDVDGD